MGLLREVNRVIDNRNVQTLFQPIIHLATNEVVGYEALTRGPSGSGVESPQQLFRAANAAGRVSELDWVCAAAASEAAIRAKLHPSTSIFLNFEPRTLLGPCPEDVFRSARLAEDNLRVIVEVKEQSLMADPRGLFDAIAQAREIGWGVAIDNVVATPASVALFPLIHPDVIKVDLRAVAGDLVIAAAMGDRARVYAERTGASILAEGIETPEDVLLARTIGATFGQGWAIGEPSLLPSEHVTPRSVVPLLSAPSLDVDATPFEIVSDESSACVTEKRYLAPLSTYFEEQVARSGAPVLLLVTSHHLMPMSGRTLARLQELSKSSALTVVLGRAPAGVDAPGFRVQAVAHDDPIGEQWNVLVLGPDCASALCARDLGDVGDEQFRRFEVSVTHDRTLVHQAVRSVLRRLPFVAPGGAAAGDGVRVLTLA